MKHVRQITKRPQIAQVSGFQLKTEFVIAIMDMFLSPLPGGASDTITTGGTGGTTGGGGFGGGGSGFGGGV
jgi:hypothetical protein